MNDPPAGRPLLSLVVQAVTWMLILVAALVILRRTPLMGRALPVLAGAALIAVLVILRRLGRGAGR